jgi:hypothetical protein
VVSVTPRPCLYPRGKDPRYPLDRKLGEPQSRSGHRGYRKNPFPPPGIEPRSPGRPARSQTLLPELTRLQILILEMFNIRANLKCFYFYTNVTNNKKRRKVALSRMQFSYETTGRTKCLPCSRTPLPAVY